MDFSLRNADSLALKTRSSRGTSILEILVACVILAVLSALFFLVYPSMQVMSRHTQCTTHLRAIYTAAIHYTTDRGGRLPDLVYWRDERERYGIRDYSLYPYINEDHTILSCPVSEADARFRTRTDRAWNGTYAINVFMVGSNDSGGSIANWDDWKGKNPIAWNLNGVRLPQEAPFFMDGPGLSDSYGTRYSVFSNPTRASTDPGDRPGSQWATPFLHPESRINIVYVDGRVDSLTRSQIIEMNWSGQ